MDLGEFCLLAYKSLELAIASSVYILKSCPVYVANRDFFLTFIVTQTLYLFVALFAPSLALEAGK